MANERPAKIVNLSLGVEQRSRAMIRGKTRLAAKNTASAAEMLRSRYFRDISITVPYRAGSWTDAYIVSVVSGSRCHDLTDGNCMPSAILAATNVGGK